MHFRYALLATTVLSVPATAMAQGMAQGTSQETPGAAIQPMRGFYVAGGAGLNILQNRDFDAIRANRLFLDSQGVSRSGTVKHDLGWVGVVSAGYGFGNGIRLELEGNYRQNGADKISGFRGLNPGASSDKASGRVRQYGAMANAFYDFSIPGLPVQPYIGAGLGYMWNENDSVRTTASGGNTVTFQDVDGGFAYQGILGVAYPISSVPGLAATAEYRYLGRPSQRVSGRVSNAAGATISQGNFHGDPVNNHSLLVGLRYSFNQPAPAAAPAPVMTAPAATARTYLVFFEFDRADLTERARQVIAQAAQASGNARIEVAGHADRSGSVPYNQRLSQRRAEAVAGELARNGVSRAAMVVQAFGESRPLVATADGVREPQNRRVEIVLR
ncbi:OmpA family protein [Roseomonas elaeocarpi]|uniref:OmpA family protein n=1 Tax=Roseomonas elaeocarpi TaxID=907779 RepID=A0ABV6JNN9_9PROT